MTRNGSLTKDLDYWDIYRDVMVLRDGRFIPTLSFDLPANDLKSTAELSRYNDVLAQMLRYAAPEGEPLTLTFHTRKDDLALTKAYEHQQTSTHPLAQAMTEDRTNLFRKLRDAGQLFQHRAYLSAVSRPPGLDSSRTPFAKLLGRKATYQSLSNAEAALKRAHATKLRSSLSRYLTQAGFTPEVPTAQEVFEVPYRYFNPGSPVSTYVPANEYYPKNLLDRFPELSPNTLRRQSTDSDLDNNPYDHLWLSGHSIVGLTMEKLPDDYSYGSMIQTLLTLPCEKWLTLMVEHVPFAKQLNAFKWKARLLRGFTSASGDDVDPTNESGFTTYRQAIGHMTVDNSHVYKLGLSMFIYATTLEEAEHYLQLAQVMISEMQGAKFMRERVGLSKRFRALAPFAGGVTDIADLLFQENAADLFPLSGPYRGNVDAPDVMYQTRYDTPVGISVFDPSCKNWNGIVAGAARSGKSFNANDVLAGVLRRQEVEAIVLDKGGSFHETVSLYDGAYIEVVKASINPFDLGEGEWQPS